ncbi:helix-turn-helix domain-containing protein [Verrucomicrobiota bacterium]
MKSEIKSAIELILKSDKSISARQRQTAIAILEGSMIPAGLKAKDKFPPLLKQREVAEFLSVSRQTVRRLTNEGILNPVKLRSGHGTNRSGDLFRYPRTEVENLAREKK